MAAIDFYALDDLLKPEELEIRDRLREFCAREVTPVASRYWEAAEFPFELIPKMAELGLAGGTIEGYGCPGMSWVAAGLVAQEWARSDGSVGTFFGVHSFLAMQTIGMLGSEEQKQRWLPAMARIEKVGAFALTEPDHGSDSVALETAARQDGDTYVLNGRKKWIGNASFADYVIVWARGEDGNVGGYVVEKGTPGYDATVITGKTALRSSWQAEIELTDVVVPAENRLAECHSFKDVGKVLTSTRYTVAWRALGLAMAAFELARDHALEREQFGKPIASFQLVQDKLSRMLAEVTTMQLLCWRASVLASEGRLTDGMASLAKLNNAGKARAVVADARDIMGGNGILLENHVARHFADMEAVFTFEGTDSIQSLIVGREITGIQAISAGGKPA
ncbi:MAG: glutaryl-CoA dehydrogenase [Solirubrobacteraceae bacterium]|jgi:glutaryl-CoA dehydrogenase|nr:glutaryl-CoA dehydrogenase [Solirubrobacteraceae bacterium]